MSNTWDDLREILRYNLTQNLSSELLQFYPDFIPRYNERIVVLCRDEHEWEIKEEFGNTIKNTIIGIRAAKGLEFTEVMLFNFFSSGSCSKDQKSWKKLLQSAHSSVSVGAPRHLECELKLLYTGITRCCERLVFAETQPGASFEFFRFLKSLDLGEALKMSSLDSLGKTQNPNLT